MTAPRSVTVLGVTLRDGQRARAEFKLTDGTLIYEGRVSVTRSGLASVAGAVVALSDPAGTLGEDLVSVVPLPDPEPPVGSVVLARDGAAWQSAAPQYNEAAWFRAASGARLTWDELNKQVGPLRVIYTPDSEPAEGEVPRRKCVCPEPRRLDPTSCRNCLGDVDA